ncbi:hypothetical protein HB952_11385 [Listeria welshimeri]|nr:hypothetical protein [Listeria welshimeri]
MKKKKLLEQERILLNIMIVLSILLILIPMDYKGNSQLWIKVFAVAFVLIVTLARFIVKLELKIIMKQYRNLGKVTLTSKEYKSVQTNEISTKLSYNRSPLASVTKVDVEIFEEALEKYMSSAFRTVNFTKKAQKALENLIQQVSDLQLAVSATHQRMLEKLDKRSSEWGKKLYDESRTFQREWELDIRKKRVSAIRNYFQKNNLIVNDIREISMGYYLVFISSDQYIIRVLADKIIDVYTLYSHENEHLFTPILLEEN